MIAEPPAGQPITSLMSTDIQTILKLRVPVIVSIGERKMTLDDVLSLRPGAILELAKGNEDPLALMVNNKSVGHGSAVKVGENFGIKVESVGTATQRIEALGH